LLAMSDSRRLEVGDDPSRSVPFDYNVVCQRELSALAMEIVGWVLGGVDEYRRTRPSSLEKLYHASRVVLQNLVNALAASRHCVLAVSRDRTSFVKSRYRPTPVSYKWFIRVLDRLSQMDPPLILVKDAFKDHNSGIGRRTRIKASPHMMTLLRR